jgi:hypothetical protein
VQVPCGMSPDNGLGSEGSKMPTTMTERQRRLTPCPALMPTLRDVVDVFEGLEKGLGFIEFHYVSQRKPTPSAIAARANTKYSAAGARNPSLSRGYVPHDGEYDGVYWIYRNPAGEPSILLRSMDRQDADGKFQWRRYLLCGIKLDSVMAVVNGAKVRLFPNAPEGFRWGY